MASLQPPSYCSLCALVTPLNPCFVPAFSSLNFFSFHFSLCPIFQSHQFAISEVSESSSIIAFREKKQQLLYKVMSGMAQNYKGSSCVPPMISSIVIQHNSLHGSLVQAYALHAEISQVSSALSTLKLHINLRAQTYLTHD